MNTHPEGVQKTLEEDVSALDPRALRSREQLAVAILSLASERDIDTVTVAQVAAEAGINRSTFYQHAASPAALLRSVLSAELDVVRAEHLDACGDIAVALGELTHGVVGHIDARRRIYRQGLGSGSGSAALHSMLGSHFERSALLLIEHRGITVRGVTGRPVPVAMVARFLAYAVVGAFETRISEDGPRPERDFMEDLRALMPPWWPIA
ncbi:helix-turn-helix domain containing protein [Arthrobacter alpinus]|uniref:TetR family transcriptional regulator n=1 Tax=Arthrobacter alpinus TaxID=656366 RepID=A0A0S2LWT8_9MICC|nr:helix-turn-helix domain-containing protein [Arthrobacter alpinus]ALO65884.1 TetR family transcriptional regulator [Arthrobacter alpinus]MDD0859312.1 helix-turn-helix domain containing protein [Arthrobacter alpinus]